MKGYHHKYNITFYDKNNKVNMGTSYGPAAELIYRKPHSPLLSMKFDKDTIFNTNFLGWGTRYLWNKAFGNFTRNNRIIGNRSKKMLKTILKHPLFDSLNQYVINGKILYIYDTLRLLNTPKFIDINRGLVPGLSIISKGKAIHQYENLKEEEFAFAVVSEYGGHIQSNEFMQEAYSLLSQHCNFVFDVEVDKVRKNGELVYKDANGFVTRTRPDYTIVAAGNACSRILRKHDYFLKHQTYPVKGYSFRGNMPSQGTEDIAFNFAERGYYCRPEIISDRVVLGGVFHFMRNPDLVIREGIREKFATDTHIGKVVTDDVYNNINENMEGYNEVCNEGYIKRENDKKNDKTNDKTNDKKSGNRVLPIPTLYGYDSYGKVESKSFKPASSLTEALKSKSNLDGLKGVKVSSARLASVDLEATRLWGSSTDENGKNDLNKSGKEGKEGKKEGKHKPELNNGTVFEAQSWAGLRPLSSTGLPLVKYYRNGSIIVFTGLGPIGYSHCWGMLEQVTKTISI